MDSVLSLRFIQYVDFSSVPVFRKAAHSHYLCFHQLYSFQCFVVILTHSLLVSLSLWITSFSFLYSHFIRIAQRSAMFIWKSLNVDFLWENKYIFYVIVLGKLHPFIINEVMIWSLCVAPGTEKNVMAGWACFFQQEGWPLSLGPVSVRWLLPLWPSLETQQGDQ